MPSGSQGLSLCLHRENNRFLQSRTMAKCSLMHTCPRKPDLNGRYTSTARLMFAPTGAFLLFLVIACSAPARARGSSCASRSSSFQKVRTSSTIRMDVIAK